MQRPLDPLRFKENRYERPNQGWVCGRAAEGHACPLGPDARGACRHTGECMPSKSGDRWSCTRPEAAGGKCAEGPLPDGSCAHPIPPCQPERSLRKSRGLFVWLAVAVTVGALLILFGRHSRHGWMDPGVLTNAHATSATRCSDCHSSDPASGPQVVSMLFAPGPRNDSALCLKCHQMGDLPMRPHGLAAATLAALPRQLPPPNERKTAPVFLRVSHALASDHAQADNLACATCHKEHHGRTFDLKRLSDAQCQSCHAAQFASFEKGHPEFAGYPYQRRTRIFFDHNSHLQQHFAEKKELAPAGCASCHVPGPGGRFMQVKNFNAACASCHASQIKGEGMTVKGVAFFTVPGIDAETLAARGISIGEWPKFADRKPTPFMEMLFEHDAKTRAALETLRGVDLLDLTKATPEQLAAAEQFAWSVKSLLFHMVVEGQAFLMKEMKDEVAASGLEMPRAALLAAQQEWMPHLLTDVRNYQQGIKPPLPEKPKPSPTAAPAAPKMKSSKKNDSLLGGDDLVAKPATPGDDLLAGGNDDLAAPTPSPAAKSASASSDDLSDILDAATAATPTPSPSAPAAPAIMSAEEWVAAGGWYRPQGSFTLFYRPMGHADPFLAAWLSASAHLPDSAAPATMPSTFAKLADPQNAGLCMKCHTAEQTSGVTTVNWLPAQPDAETRPFTTFNHSTHFSLVGDAGCQTCHTLNAKSEYPKFFARDPANPISGDAMKFQSNFAPISKMLCAECHQPRVAGDGCIICHRYHAAPKAGKLAEIGKFHTAEIGKPILTGKPATGK